MFEPSRHARRPALPRAALPPPPRGLGWAALGLGLLLSAAAAAQPTRYPLSLQNCGESLRFERAPGNAVAIGQSVTEVLYALGLGERMAGTALWFNAVLPAFREQDARVPRLADNAPSFESVIARRPGLVATQFESMLGPQGMVGTRAQFHGLGVPTYVMPADCEGKDNRVGADGTRAAAFSTESLYRGITELAAVFDRQERGAALVAALRAREAAAVARARALALPDASAAFWFSSADLGRDPFMAGEKGIPGFMMRALGLRNVVRSDEEWPTVGWESIARADPSVLVLARMDRRRFPADDVDRKLAFLRADPVTREMTAVRLGRIVVIDAQAMEATIRLLDGLEALTDAMAGLRP